jgi:MYXO-CTERM domain-containing protein
MNFYSASYNPAYSCVWGVVLFLCQANGLAAGDAATFRLIVEPQITGEAIFAASIGADQPDPDKSNNAVETTVTVGAANKSGGGGGCAYHPGAPADPTLPGLLAMAVLALVWRRRRGSRMLRRDASETGA